MKSVQMLFESYTFLEGIGCSFISFPIAQIKIAKYVTFLSISHQIRFCTTSDQVCIPRQINAYVSSKWPLTFPCAYLYTLENSPSESPLKRIDDG
ncbi:hypothetical protein T06_14494 [Trichinella sp. T6]|nr:hypothetical protein T06_14494 [Trichinella sp. T6]